MDVKKIVEGGMICAFYGVMIMIDKYTGSILSSMLFIISPLPLIIYTTKHKLKAGILIFFAMLVLMILLGSLLSMIYLIPANTIGLLIGYLTYKQTSFKKAFIYTVMICFINGLIVSYGFATITKTNDMADIIEAFARFNIILSNQIALLLVPVVLAIVAIMEAYLVMVVAMYCLVRLKMNAIKVPMRYVEKGRF